MVLDGWQSLDELFVKYKQLKTQFDSFSVDFRLRIFNRNDFKKLRVTMSKIHSDLPNCSIQEKEVVF